MKENKMKRRRWLENKRGYMNVGRRKFRLWLEGQTDGSVPQIVGYHNHCSDCPIARFLGHRVLNGPSMPKWARKFMTRVDNDHVQLLGNRFVPITANKALAILDKVK